jgi:hypothetical protein
MKHWLRRWATVAVLVFVLASLPVTGLANVSPAVSRAADACGVGWYYNTYYRSCQPFAPAAYPPGPNVTACVTATGRRGRVSGSVCVAN